MKLIIILLINKYKISVYIYLNIIDYNILEEENYPQYIQKA